MSKTAEYSGICSTCRNAPTCTYLKDPEQPVLQCEEFEICGSPPVKTAAKDVLSSKTSPPRINSAQKESVGYKGLCSDCENRESCMYPKPDGGVWHCEEYR